MQLPKFHETFIPILEILGKDGIFHYRDLAKRVANKYYSDLPKEIWGRKNQGGESVLLDRITWGKSYLKQAKFVSYPEKGFVQITDKGKKILEKGVLAIQELKKDSDFLAHRKLQEEKKLKNIEENIIDENASPQDLIDSGINSIEAEIKTEILEKLKVIDPYYFEKVILQLLNKMGYGDFIETAKSGDGGIDGIINEDKLGLAKIYIQAKRYNENKVREKDIRNFIGAMSGDTSKGVFVTTSNFDEKAIVKARDAHHSIILIDGSKLVDLMYEYGIGVQVSNVYEVKEVDSDFFEGN